GTVDVSFDDVSVVGPDGIGPTFTKHFESPDDAGDYIITLVVTDNDGLTDCCSQAFTVVVPPCECVELTADPMNPNVGDPVTFTVETLGCLEPVTYEWDFDNDGSVDDTTSVNTSTHAYASHGNKTACVTVTGAGAPPSTCCVQLYVNALPICVISGPSTGTALEPLCFSGADSYDPDGGVLLFVWDFDDDEPVALVNPGSEESTGDGDENMPGWTQQGADVPRDWCRYQCDYGPPVPCVLSGSYQFAPWGFYNGAWAESELYQTVTVSPDSSYYVSCWVAYVANAGKWITVRLRTRAGDHTAAATDFFSVVEHCCDHSGWLQKDTVVTTGPAQTQLTLGMATESNDNWQFAGAWFDDWELVRVGYSTEESPCYTYSAPGTYTVELCVTDDEGTTVCCTHEVVIAPAPNLPPVCDFDWTPLNPTDLDTVQFTDQSTPPEVDDAIVAWAWDFGDGGTSSDPNPTHTFADDGVYNVCLTVTDTGRGGIGEPKSSTCCKEVTVSNVGPECCIEGPTSGQATVELCWTSCSTDPDGTIVSSEWTFGDEPPVEPVVDGFETWPGDWTVFDSCGAGDCDVSQSATDPHGGSYCALIRLRFDSGAELGLYKKFTGLTPNNTGNVTIWYKMDDGGDSWWMEHHVWLNAGDATAFPDNKGNNAGDTEPGKWTQRIPKYGGANWGEDSGTGGVWESRTISNTTNASGEAWIGFVAGSWGADKDIYIDDVTFDSSFTLSPPPATGESVCHTYTAEGSYELCLTVTDDDGATHTCCQTVVISENHPPNCDFSYSPLDPTDEDTVQFTDLSTDPDGDNIVAWDWDFGDGSTSTEQNPTHTFAAGECGVPATYAVCLTVTDDGTPPLSSEGPCCASITVTHVNQAPTCEITSGPATLTRGEEGCFEATASDLEDDCTGTPLTYSWDLDGGAQSYGWADMYEADVVPTDAGWNRYEGDLTGEIIDIGGGNNAWHLVDPSDRKGKFAKNWPMGGGITVVSRMKLVTSNDDNSMFCPCYIEGDDSNQHVRARGGSGHIKIDRADSGNGNYGTLNYDQWYILRLTAGAGAGQWHLYMDENPVAVGSGNCGADGSDRVSIGANSTGSSGEIVVDFVYTALGAYAPGDPMGPQIPGGDQGPRICASWDTLGVKNVCLTVTDSGGLTGTCCHEVEIVNIDPSCSITVDPALAEVGRDTTFNANASDADGTVVSYAWDFGDGGTASVDPATHAYATAGSYTVTCTVTDNDGGEATCTLVVDANDPPVCIIDGPSTGTTCQELCFSAGDSYDPDGGALTYLWDMGDAPGDLSLSDPSFETMAGWTMYYGVNEGSFGWCGYAARTGSKFFGGAASWGHKSGGAYQQVSGADVGGFYKASIWINSVSWHNDGSDQSGNVHTHVGVDPAGGTDPAAASWSDDSSNMVCGPGPYSQRSVVVQAASSTMTVFVEYYNDSPVEWSIMAMDDVALNGAPTSGTGEQQCVTYKECKDYTVTLTVTDDEGISTTCTTTVTITDGCPPEIVECPPDRNVQGDENSQAPAPDLCPELVATDDCDDSLACYQDPAPGTMLSLGPNTITLTVCDDTGNCASCETVVTVGDGTPPEITCPDPGPYCVDETCTYPCPAATATDNVDPDPLVEQDPAAGTPLAPGHYDIAVTATDDAGNVATAVCPIDVIDCDPPVITCPPDITVENDPGECSAAVDLITCVEEPVTLVNPGFEEGATGWTMSGALDINNHGDWGMPSRSGGKMALAESCWGGIEGDAVQEVHGLEAGANYTACAYVLSVSVNYYNGTLCNPADQSASVAVDIDCNGSADVSTTINPSWPPAYYLVCVDFTATGECARIVLESWSIGGGCEWRFNAFDDVTLGKEVCSGSAEATDNCGVVSLTNDGPATGIFPVGETLVTWTACDAAGNCSSCGQLVTVNDTEPPSISCPGDMTVGTDPGECSAVVTYSCDAADNCPGESCSCNPPSGSTFSLGTTTVTCTATDAAGNERSCTFTVTVEDRQPPSIECPPDVTAVSDDCEPIEVEIGEASPSDNCGVTDLYNDAPALFPVGDTTVTWTACDAAGNCASCEQTVTVICPPTCNITYSPASPTTDDVVTFDSGAADPDGGTIVSVDWDFGDGGTASGDPATHQYAMPDCYVVTVVVCDDDSLCATCTAEVCVDKGVGNPPVCDITYEPDKPIEEQVITFYSNAYDPDPWGEIVSYEWDFDDDGIIDATGDPATHSYAAVGDYPVCVTVTDDQDNATTCCTTVRVYPKCFCDVAIDRTHCKLPAFGQVGQCKLGQIGAKNMSLTEACDVVLRVTDNMGNVVFEDTANIGPGRRIRVRFEVCATADQVGKWPWTWEVWPAECNELTEWNNVTQRRVIVRPGTRTGW
ncbi:hypothetical protein AMK68_02510, partial [candidate division KD3-62 bacterium DG_56]